MTAIHHSVRLFVTAFAALWSDRRGATAVEYGLILAFVVIAMLIGFSSMSSVVLATWNRIAQAYAAI